MEAVYISSNQFKVSTDKTSEFITGRRIRANCGGNYQYSTIQSSTYSNPYTTVTIEESVLTSNLSEVHYGIVNIGEQGSFPKHSHDGSEGTGGGLSFSILSDTPTTYSGSEGKYLKTTSSGIEFIDDLYTKSEVDTISGTLQSNIDDKADISHSHDDRYYTETEVDTISGTLQTDIDTKLENIVEDTNPELGGDLSCNNYNFNNVGKICSFNLATTIYNNTGSTLTKGTAVTICGLHNEICTVCITDNRETGKMPCCGIVDADIAAGAEGCGIRLGRINMDTSGMTGSAEDRLYVQSDGSLDTTIPSSGMVQRVGFLVVKASGNSGRICVCIRGPRSMYSAKNQHPIIRMGNDAGHQKVVFRDYNDDEIAAFDDSGNLTLSGTVDTVDVATFKSDYDSHEHDNRYYTESEVGTISGTLQTNIDEKVSDTTYGGSWNGEDDIAPSQNAVYDEMETKSSKTTAAWSKSIGSGGDYATWAAMIADMPDLIAHEVTVTIKAGTTLTETCDLKNKHGLTPAAAIIIQAEKYFPTSGAIPTADSATATTLRDAALATAALGNDYFNGCWVFIVDGTGTDNGFVPITDYVDATGDVVVANWPGTQPDNTSRYLIVGVIFDGEGTKRNYDMSSDTTAIIMKGIGFDDCDNYNVINYCSNIRFDYCGIYGSYFSGLQAIACQQISYYYCGIVKNNTSNNSGHSGLTAIACNRLYIYRCGISDNSQRGILGSNGSFCILYQCFGDSNGAWGLYCRRSAQAYISVPECSGSSGNHSDPGTAGTANADQASAY